MASTSSLQFAQSTCAVPRGASRRPKKHHGLLRFTAQAASLDEVKAEVHPGMFGSWSIDDADIREVYGYRAGISVSAAALVAGVAASLLALPVPKELLNADCVVGSAGLGLSLVLIHIYVTPIKRVIQSLWALGTAGGLWLMATQDDALPAFVAQHNWSTLLIGPLFAAVTGVAIKEGLCYGKAEAAVLALVTPLWLLGHLTGAVPSEVENALALLFTLTYTVFAGRKYTQAIKDDIGDKSVFEFRKLPEAEQHATLERMDAS